MSATSDAVVAAGKQKTCRAVNQGKALYLYSGLLKLKVTLWSFNCTILFTVIIPHRDVLRVSLKHC